MPIPPEEDETDDAPPQRPRPMPERIQLIEYRLREAERRLSAIEAKIEKVEDRIHPLESSAPAIENRLSRVEKFILGLLVLVATSVLGALLTLINIPKP